MRSLAIHCFGPPRAEVAGLGALHFHTEKSFELLILAALADGALLTRSAAASTLRLDQPEVMARRALSTDLWRLRKAFSDAGVDSGDYLAATSRGIGIRSDARVSLDLRAFEARFDELAPVAPEDLTPDQIADLVEIASLYCGDALPDFDQEWSFVLRERLRSKHVALIDKLLAHALAGDDWSAAIGWARRLLELDPMLEHAHRALMQCHFLTGNRGIAIRQYTECAEILRRDLDVDPSEETTRMYRGLLSVQVTPPAASVRDRVTETIRSPAMGIREADRKKPLTDQLSMALGNLNQARSLVENVDTELRRKR